MFLANIQSPRTWQGFIRDEPFLTALHWIQAMPRDQEPGIFEIRGKEIFVNVHGYETLPREECRFESHRKYVDLQYCIAGGECIDHASLARVEPATSYDAETDLLFHRPAVDFSILRMAPGDFALFWPDDAHRPKVQDGRNASVRKLVVKIALDLIG